MTDEKGARLAYAAVLGVVVFWGGAFTAAKIAVAEIPPFSTATLRYALASLILVIVLHRREGLTTHVNRSNVHWLVILGVLGVFGYNALLFWGLKYSSAVNGSLIAGANPAATALLAALLVREAVKARQILGIAVSFGGVILLVTKGSLDTLIGLEINLGDLLLIGSLFCFAVNSVVAKKALTTTSLTPWTVTTYSALIGTVALLPFMAWEYFGDKWQTASVATWISIGYLGIFASVLAYVWWFFAIAKIGATRASIFTNLVPVTGTVIAVVIGKETFLLAHAIGAVLVILGVVLTTGAYAAFRKQPAAT